MPLISINGKFIDSVKANVSVSERAFRFGDGVFETIRIHNGKLYRINYHLARLAAGLEALKIKFQTSHLRREAENLIAENRLREGFLRIHVSRGAGSRGYMPEKNAVPLCVIETVEKSPWKKPATLWFSEIEKPSRQGRLKGLKGPGTMNSVAALMEARESGLDEALQLEDGFVAECSSGNIFWLLEDVLYTPSLELNIIPGCIRDRIISLYDVKEGKYPLSHMTMAEEVFVTNVNWLARPVETLAPIGFSWEIGPKAAAIKKALEEDIENECK